LVRDSRGETALAWAALVAMSYVYRLPPLLSAHATNSDAAVVGLQAMHLLRGEWSPFLWGSGYQTSADALVAALFFVVLGANAVALMLSSLTLHVMATGLAFETLRRREGPWTSLLLVLPLIFAPSSIHSYALYPPRQLSLTLAMASFWAIHAASKRTGAPARAWLAGGAAAYGLAIGADPYPMVLAPAVLGYAIVVAAPRANERLLPLVTGLLFGLLPFVALRSMRVANAGPLGLSTSVIGHNWALLVRECLPWALSYKVYFARNVMDYAPWDAPLLIRAIQILGAVTAALIVALGIGTIRHQGVPRSTRLLGFFAAACWPIALVAFLLSVMVMDHFSMRYLAVLTFVLPFAAAPAATLIGPKRFAIAFAPHVLASAIGGWVGYGPLVNGLVPVRESTRDDDALLELLTDRALTVAEADYWTAYRLTFLYREHVVVVPTNPAEDRYAPYRRAFERAARYAYVFDPGRSREDLAEAERKLIEAEASVERTSVGKVTVFVVTRR
jgi:hypothetical protein